MSEPWVGRDYAQVWNRIGGFRVLVLGESHYGEGRTIGEEIPEMTNYVVSEVLSGRWKLPFFGKVANLLLGRAPHSHEEFVSVWDSVVFANYIPVVAANDSRQRPPEHLWSARANSEFRDLLCKKEIEAVLICGTELWRRLEPVNEEPQAYQANGRGWNARSYPTSGQYSAIAAHIPHPSGSFGWTYNRCRPVVDFLIERAASNRIGTSAPALVDWR